MLRWTINFIEEERRESKEAKDRETTVSWYGKTREGRTGMVTTTKWPMTNSILIFWLVVKCV